jgi:hypothetical protein
MYDSYIMKRTQIYLDEGQDDRLARRARAAGVTKSTLIRDAIERYLEEGDEPAIRLSRWRAALSEAFGAAPYLSEGSRYVEDIRQADIGRQRDLDARRKT